MKIILRNSDLYLLKSLLSKNNEVGGILPVIDIYHDTILLSYDPSMTTTGTPSNLTMELPDTAAYIFHTHPIHAYLKSRSNKGWLSGVDIEFILSNPQVKVHFIISLEGVYAIRPLQRDLSPDDASRVVDAVTKLEKFREYGRAYQFSALINHLNTLKSNNSRIMEITLHSWHQPACVFEFKGV